MEGERTCNEKVIVTLWPWLATERAEQLKGKIHSGAEFMRLKAEVFYVRMRVLAFRTV